MALKPISLLEGESQTSRSRYTHIIFARVQIIGESWRIQLINSYYNSSIINLQFLFISCNCLRASVYNFAIIRIKVKLVWFYSKISTSNHIFWRVIWNQLPECSFENFEISKFFKKYELSMSLLVNHTKPTNTLRAITNQRAGNYKITPLLEQCRLQSILWLVLVITCLWGQFGINYPNETRAISILSKIRRVIYPKNFSSQTCGHWLITRNQRTLCTETNIFR